MKKLLLSLLLIPILAHAAVTMPVNGGTGTSTKPTFGKVLMGLANGTYAPTATSSLGFPTSTGWTFSSSTIWGLFSNTTTGLTYNNGTGATSLTSGYNIPLTASTTNWNNFYNASSTFITNPMTTLGDMIYGASAGVPNRIAGNTSSSTLYLTQTGDGVNAGTPSWQPLNIPGVAVYFQWGTQSTSSPAYFVMSPTATSTGATKSFAGLSGTTFLQNWITATGIPGVTILPKGMYNEEIYAAKTAGTQNVTLYAEIWEVSSTGVDIAKIATTNSTSNLTGIVTAYSVDYERGDYVMSSINSRLVVRIYAVVSGGGSAPTVQLSYGNGTDANLTTPGATVDVTNFIPYIGATKNIDLGTFGVTTSGYLNASSSNTFPTYSYASSTFASTSWVTSTFAPFASPTFTGKVTLPNASTTAMTLSGSLYDSITRVGTNGQVLWSTGTSTLWVATSTLGISGGSGVTGGTAGKVARFTDATTLNTGILFDNGTVSGVNATSTTYTFNIKGNSGVRAFGVSTSSSASAVFTIEEDGDATIHGIKFGTGKNSGTSNVAVGLNALNSASFTGTGNTAVGENALQGDTTANNNTAFGYRTLFAINTGSANTALGRGVLGFATSSTFNTGAGCNALAVALQGSNTAFGGNSLTTLSTGLRNVAIGFSAGKNQTNASDSFYVDNQDRGSDTAENSSSLLYGIFNAATTSQSLTINGNTTVGQNFTASKLSTLATTTVSGTLAIGTTTASASLDVHGIGTTTNPTFQASNSVGTVNFQVLDSGAVTQATTTLNGNLSITGAVISRVVGYTASSTITINVDTTDEATTTVNQTTTFANPTGTAIDGMMYLMTVRATTTQTLAWGTNFASSTDLAYPLTVASGTTEILWKYDLNRGKYLLLGLLKTFMN